MLLSKISATELARLRHQFSRHIHRTSKLLVLGGVTRQGLK